MLLTSLRNGFLRQLNKPHSLAAYPLKFSSFLKDTKVDVNGQTINYVKTGSGENVVLCFPGALGTIWSDFKPQIEGLNKSKFTVVAWDPPGYGSSRPPDRNFRPEFYHNDAVLAKEFMKDKLGIEKFSLLGWSDGGISSLILASKYPDVVDKLVVWGSNAYITPEEVATCDNLRDLSKWSDKMKTPLIKLYTEEGLRKMCNDWCDALNTISSQGGDICKENLKDIKCPTLILHGDKDPMVLPEHPVYLQKHIKGSNLHRFPDGKHNIHLRYSGEFNNIVSEFLLTSFKNRL